MINIKKRTTSLITNYYAYKYGLSFLAKPALFIALMAVSGCMLDYSLKNETGTDTDSVSTDTFDTDTSSAACGCALASWSEDLETDFSDNNPLLHSTIITSSGSVTGEAYRTGALIMTAYPGQLLADLTNATWEDLLAEGETGRIISGNLDQNWNVIHPPGLGIATFDNFTIGFEGEIEFEHGETYTFHVNVDDRAFIEIFDGNKWWRASALAGTSTHDFSAPSPGWYPIRIAIGETSEMFFFNIQYSSKSVTQTTIPSSALRLPLSNIHGLEMLGFDQKTGHAYKGARLDTGAIDHAWGLGRPSDLNLTKNDEFAVRWIGQVRTRVSGDHHFNLVTNDGQRLWVDGELLLNHWDDTYYDDTGIKTLTAGWHDIIVDFRENLDVSYATLRFGPLSPELADTTIPPDRFRPAIRANESTTAGFSGSTSYIIPDPGETNFYIHVPAPIGNAIKSVDLCFEISHDRLEDLILTLYHPDRTPLVVQNHKPNGSPTHCYQNISEFNGKEAAGIWRLKVQDDVPASSGLFKEWSVVVNHQTSTGSIWDPNASYTSQIFDAGNTVEFTTLTYGSTLPVGASLEVSTRTADDTETLLGSPWSSGVASERTIPIGKGRYFQYRVAFTPGADQASLDDINIEYCPCP